MYIFTKIPQKTHTECIKKQFISNGKLLNFYNFRDKSTEKFMHKKTNKSCVLLVILVELQYGTGTGNIYHICMIHPPSESRGLLEEFFCVPVRTC